MQAVYVSRILASFVAKSMIFVMDTMATNSWYLVIKDVATLGLTLTGLVIAGMGLATWKKQIRGAKEFETAYNTNYSVLKLRAAIKHVRNPFVWATESEKAIEHFKSKYPDQSEKERRERSQIYVYEMRWQKIIDASTELESHLLAAELLWGAEILALVRPITRKVSELNTNLNQNFEPDYPGIDRMKIHSVIYDGGHEDQEDAFGTQVNDLLQGVSTYLKQKMY